MNKDDVIRLVEEYMEVEEPLNIKVEVLHQQVRPDGDFWYIPVRTDYNLPKRFPYYEKLTDVEIRLHDENHLNVMLVPS